MLPAAAVDGIEAVLKCKRSWRPRRRPAARSHAAHRKIRRHAKGTALELQGVAMQRPDRWAFTHEVGYVIDEWR